MSYKLFIPGPVEVSEKTYRAMTTPVFGHRSADFVQLYQSIQPGLQQLLFTQRSGLSLHQFGLGGDGGLHPQPRP
jgi:aspartate aminotransferase-like enzyme